MPRRFPGCPNDRSDSPKKFCSCRESATVMTSATVVEFIAHLVYGRVEAVILHDWNNCVLWDCGLMGKNDAARSDNELAMNIVALNRIIVLAFPCKFLQ